MVTCLGSKCLKQLVGIMTVLFVLIVSGAGTFLAWASTLSSSDTRQATDVIIDVKYSQVSA